MLTRTKVSIYTFVGVAATIVGIGAVAVPYLMRQAQNEYVKLEVDVNQRQAQMMTRILRNDLDAKVDPNQVIREFQAAIEGSHDDRGYLCMVDQATGVYLCHPRQTLIGMMAKKGGATLETPGTGDAPRPFADLLMSGPVDTGGLLTFPVSEELRKNGYGAPEIVYSLSVPNTKWTVSSHENTRRLEQELAMYRSRIITWAVFLAVAIAIPATMVARWVSGRYEGQIEDKNALLAAEQARSERLLLNVLPGLIAARMKNESGMIADYYEGLTVLFCDIVGFSAMSGKVSPTELVSMLNTVFLEFDRLTTARGLEKIKTIGDCYMVVGGAPTPRADHAEAVADLALDLLGAVGRLEGKFKINVRIGMDTGSAVAGVIGSSKFAFDLWGDTVNTASRMESHGQPGRIHCTAAVARALEGKFVFESCGMIEVKSKGPMETYFLVGRRKA